MPLPALGLRYTLPDGFDSKPEALAIGQALKDEDDHAITDDSARRVIAHVLRMLLEDVPNTVPVYPNVTMNDDLVRRGNDV